MVVDNTGHPDVRTPSSYIFISGITKVKLCLKKESRNMRCFGQSRFEEAGMSVRKGPNELTCTRLTGRHDVMCTGAEGGHLEH
jgi:hypothetical protein